jgi:hypothetical protein
VSIKIDFVKLAVSLLLSSKSSVALVELKEVSQGSYRCANGGKCIAPDKCACAKGWIGFDCRVPVCEQGYYEPHQDRFVKGVNNENELDTFEIFMQKHASYRLDPLNLYSNPFYFRTVERFLNESHIERKKEKYGGISYLQDDGKIQGGYSCSIRSVTEWENYRSGFLFEHPNYFSRYMDKKVEADGKVYTHWEGMGFIPTYHKSHGLQFDEKVLTGLNYLNRTFVYTDQGFRKDGTWKKTGEQWTKGLCILEFKRACQSTKKSVDLESSDVGRMVQDPDLVSDHSLRLSDIVFTI